MALKDLVAKLGLDSSGFSKGMKNARSDMAGLKKSAQKTQGGIAGLAGGLKSLVKTSLALAGVTMGLKAIGDSMKAYVGLESSVIRVNDLFGDASKYVRYFAENTGKAFGMAEASAYQYAAVYGNLFKNITASAEENSKVTIAMMKSSAVIASKTGRTMEDVMERIRSGLMGNTEAIEDLGVYVNVAMLETTDAFKQLADGRSWEQLTFYEQQQIRTLGILEQAHDNFGDTVQKGSAFNLSVLGGVFKDLATTMGQFINAGLQPVISGLIQLVQWATAGLKALAALMGLQINVGSSGAAGTNAQTAAQAALTDEVEATAKAQSKLAGFDQFNDITAKSGGDAADGAASGAGVSVFDGLAMPEFEIAEPKITWLDGLISKFNSLRDMELFKGLETSVKGLFNSLQKAFSDVWNIVVFPFADTFRTQLAPIIGAAMGEVVKTITVQLEEITKIFNLVWDEGVRPGLELFVGMWSDFASLLRSKWEEYGAPIFEAIRKAITGMSETWQKIWSSVLKPIWDTMMQTIDWLWINHLQPLVSNIIDFVATLIQSSFDIYNGFILPLINFFVEWLGPSVVSAVSTIIDVIGTVVGFVADIVAAIIKVLTGLIKFVAGAFTGDWGKAWEGIKEMFSGIWDGIVAILKAAINLLIDGINVLIRGLNKISFDFPDWVPGIGGESFGISIPLIPKLAKGGLAFGETLAVVGDNPHAGVDPEVISPLSALKNMIVEAMVQTKIVTGGNGEMRFIMQLESGEVLVDMMIDPMNNKARNLGYDPVFKPANT